jgi:dGTPase
VEVLEQKYPRFSGLNLSWEVREGLMKHSTPHDHPGKFKGLRFRSPSLEAQVANLADEITYYSHDLDDGLDSGLLAEKQLRQEVKLWRKANTAVEREYGKLPDECRRYFIIRCIIDMQVKDVVETTESQIRSAGITTANDVRRQAKPLVRYSPERVKENQELRRFLYQNLYFNPVVDEPHIRARRILEELFKYYLRHHDAIGTLAQKRARREGWPRAICDYLAGMTDRFALQEHQRLFPIRM